MEEECFWVNLREDNKVSESKMAVPESNMAEFKMAVSGSVWIQHGRIQDGWYHQVESEWMSLKQIELVWVRVLCKMAESKMAEFKMEELKMVAIIKLIRLN